MTEPITTEQIMEAAFSWGGDEQSWFARITWKCSVCGRRNCELKKGPGPLASALPITMKCKQDHETLVMPYHWRELYAKLPGWKELSDKVAAA
jgi:hypothetical protein